MILVSRQRDLVSKVERELVPWPKTARQLAPDWGDDLACARNGGEFPRDQWDAVLADRDHVHFYAKPGFQLIPGIAPWVAALLNQIAIAAALAIATRLLFPAKKPHEPDEEDSSTYSWASIQPNQRFEGTVMPVPYGRHRMAPPIVNSIVRTSLDQNGNPVSELLLLMLLSDGQIRAVGDKTADGGPFRNDDGTFLKTLQINGQPAENLEEVEAYVRLGTAEQEVIPGFANPSLQYSLALELAFPPSQHKSPFGVVGSTAFGGTLTGYTNGQVVSLIGGTGTAATFRLTVSGGNVTAVALETTGSYTVATPSPASVAGGLTITPVFDAMVSAQGDSASDPAGSTNTPTANSAVAIAGQWDPAHVNVTKWGAYGEPVAYTSGDDADEFTLLFVLPQGLGDFRTSTALNTVVYQVRYRRVDAGGVPFGNYIVLGEERLALARNSSFAVEFRRKFFTPDVTYVAPQFGLFLRARTGNNGTTNRGARCVIDAAKFPSRIKAEADFTFSCWIRSNATLPETSVRTIFSWFGSNKGIRLGVVKNGSYANFIVEGGTGSSTFAYQNNEDVHGTSVLSKIINGAEPQFHHLVVAYDADGFNLTTGLIHVFVDTYHIQFSDQIYDVPQIEWDPTLPIYVQSDSHTAPARGFNCDMDEPTLWTKLLSAYEISRLYNFGRPLTVDDAAEGLIIGGRFDSGTTTSPAFGPMILPSTGSDWILGDGTGNTSINNPEISNAPTNENGLVKTKEQGAPLRGKFLVEAMRLNVEDEEVGLTSKLEIQSISLTTFQEFVYPGCGLLAVRVQGSEQLGSGQTRVTAIVDGRLVPVWDGVDAVYPNMVPTWSRNPAWIAVDILTDPNYGLGNVYVYSDIDVVAFQDLADYCDELVYDGLTRLTIIDARQIDAADSANLPTALEGGSQDYVRYKVNRVPPNWPQPTSGLTSTGKYTKFRVTGTPVPSIPAWLVTEIAASPQEIKYVEFSSGFFYVYVTSSVAVGATTALYTPNVSTVNYIEGEVHDVRFRYDGVFDRADVPAWDAVTQVLQVARAIPIRMGSRVSVFCDKPAQPVALITMGNIIQGTFRSTSQGVADRPNVEQVEFFDEDLNFERTFVTDELPEVTDPSKQSAFNFRRVRLEGVTRRGQAKRHSRRDLNVFNLVREMISFEVGIGGLPLMPGDLIDFSHDVPGLGFSGRLIATSANQTSVKLDRPVVIGGGSYQIQVEHAANGARETKPVTSGAGNYAAGATINVGGGGFSFTPEEMDVYAFGVIGTDVAQYRLVESTLNAQTLRRKIRALEYNEDTYSDDFGTLSESLPTSLPIPSAPVIPPGVENLVVSEETTTGPDGSVKIVAAVSFTHYPTTYESVAWSDVYVSHGTHDLGRDSAVFIARLDRATVTHRFEYPFARDRTYTVWVIPRAVTGASYRVFASYSEFTPSGLAPAPAPPGGFRGAISGELATYEWDDSPDIDHGAIVEIRRGGWILGVPVASAPAQAREVTSDWAGGPANANGVAAPELVARVKLKTGQYSEAVVLSMAPTVASAEGDVLERSEEDFNWA